MSVDVTDEEVAAYARFLADARPGELYEVPWSPEELAELARRYGPRVAPVPGLFGMGLGQYLTKP